MALSWSHAVIYVNDTARMLDFYGQVLGFELTDRGQIGNGNTEIIFLSQTPREHHQLAFIPTAGGGEDPNRFAHLAFRVGDLAELRAIIGKLETRNVQLRPISHGNTWSVYVADPEGNGIELFCETPWHVKQPAGEVWDTKLSDSELLAWTQQMFASADGFAPIESYYAAREKALT